ncbi:MAG: hypothetical protein ABIP20_00585 [Chthoniobacteraceae bacterium]
MTKQETNTASAERDPQSEVLDEVAAKRLSDALGSAYIGITCSQCSSIRVIRAGACGVCLDCGSSEGCG